MYKVQMSVSRSTSEPMMHKTKPETFVRLADAMKYALGLAKGLERNLEANAPIGIIVNTTPLVRNNTAFDISYDVYAGAALIGSFGVFDSL